MCAFVWTFFFSFFFQAEDGIRDYKVTGVQTCALPICRYFATSNICTHEGAKLHEGEIHAKELTCPRHGAKWDLTTGHLTWFREYLEPLGSYTVVIEDDVLFVE